MLILAALTLAQSAVISSEPLSILPGQLEVVIGLRSIPDTVMALYFGKDIDATFNGGKITPGGYVGFNFGFVRFATTSEDFLGLPVWHARWSSKTSSRKGKKEWRVDATEDYWVDNKGTIRRQAASFDGPDGRSEAQADYYPDHIEIKRNVFGKFDDQLLYPGGQELTQLNEQFRPMVVDGKVILREKSYLSLDLFRGAFQLKTARVAGKFDGVECDAHFHGYEIDLEERRQKQGVCVSDDNNLVTVDLQEGRWIKMTSLPSNRLKENLASKGHG